MSFATRIRYENGTSDELETRCFSISSFNSDVHYTTVDLDFINAPVEAVGRMMSLQIDQRLRIELIGANGSNFSLNECRLISIQLYDVDNETSVLGTVWQSFQRRNTILPPGPIMIFNDEIGPGGRITKKGKICKLNWKKLGF